MKALRNYIVEKDDIQSIIDGVENGLDEQLIAGLTGPARSLFITGVQRAQKKKMLIITHQLMHAQRLYEDIIEFSDNNAVYLYPVNELIATEMAIASPELKMERMKAITNWLQNPNSILIAPVAALKRMLPPATYWIENQLTIEESDQLLLKETLDTFVKNGYARVDMVTAPGEFSVRGGIIDIYPVTERHPVRIELFDEEIDSIRYFDATTQRSLDTLTEVTIGPAR